MTSPSSCTRGSVRVGSVNADSLLPLVVNTWTRSAPPRGASATASSPSPSFEPERLQNPSEFVADGDKRRDAFHCCVDAENRVPAPVEHEEGAIAGLLEACGLTESTHQVRRQGRHGLHRLHGRRRGRKWQRQARQNRSGRGLLEAKRTDQVKLGVQHGHAPPAPPWVPSRVRQALPSRPAIAQE